MSKKRFLEGIKDQVLMWAMTLDTRQVSQRIQATHGTYISHVTIAGALTKWRGTSMAETRADSIQRVTGELLEGEWGKLFVEARANYDKAKDDGDGRGMLAWYAERKELIEMLLKVWEPSVVRPPVQAQVEDKGIALRAWAKRVLDEQ